MLIQITGDSVGLVDPQDCGSLSVRNADGLTDDELAARAAAAGLGELLASGHLMVPVATLRALAGDRVGPGWEDDLAAMLAYAAGRGWTSADGQRVRAHIEPR